MLNYFDALDDNQKNTVVDRFNYHQVDDVNIEKMKMLRERAVELASAIIILSPVSREQSLALTNLEQALFWANASIARPQSK
ncbi:MAG: hypothetical protein MN733_31920 [Nitrososphaera sp.]|nr:hypothetical protein [Nitrososphaera sp.]